MLDTKGITLIFAIGSIAVLGLAMTSTRGFAKEFMKGHK